ncbi:hypothetical protein SynBIOSE41_02777 [Synechococcus sp. BIOS-E4-1]|nr:hypothetical protein SynBIOSE41_02777 [Synechococcus sp. BIOS-E4-1]
MDLRSVDVSDQDLRSNLADSGWLESAASCLIVEPDEVTNELAFIFRLQLQHLQELLPC